MNKAVISYYGRFFPAIEKLEEMLILQDEANAVMQVAHSDAPPYYRATVVEGVEAIQHFGYKWWKKTEADLGQVKMELIDILHFALSDILRTSSAESVEDVALECHCKYYFEPVIFAQIGRFAKGFDFPLDESRPVCIDQMTVYHVNTLDNFTFNDMVEQLVFFSLRDGSTSLPHLFALFEKLGMSTLEVHGLYAGKNALNKFRTANGQLSHDYEKIWDGREDNEYLTDFLVESREAGTELDFDAIYNFLEVTYSKAVVREKKA